MRRYSSPYASSFSFGPGPISTALKALIGINVVTFVAQIAFPVITTVLGLHPAWIIPAPSPFPPEHVLWVWQLATYMFLHGGIFHIVFNMLALWMFGAALTVLFSLLPFGFARQLQYANVIGASGAIYGLLLAYALYFPDRPIYMYLLFPIPAKIFVAIMGAIAFLSSMSDAGGVANATHLGGLLVAYVYLTSLRKGPRIRLNPWAEVKYRWVKWRLATAKKKFDVYTGGRGDGRIH